MSQLPKIREPSRRRARFVDRTFGAVFVVLVLLVVGWGWAMATLRFEVTARVEGVVVSVEGDRVVAETHPVDEGDPVPATAIRPGIVALAEIPGTGLVLEGIVTRIESDGDQPTITLDLTATDLEPVTGAPIQARLIVRSATGLELLGARFGF